MFDAHALVHQLGIAAARRAATNALERVCVEAASALVEAGPDPSRLIHGSLLSTCMPYRDPGLGCRVWERRFAGQTFTLAAIGRDSLPFGAKARIILLHLFDSAVRSGSPNIETPNSLRAFMQSMGIPLGGMTYRHFADQTRRIGCTRLQIVESGGEQREILPPCPLVAQLVVGEDIVIPAEQPIPGAFPRRVILDPAFFAHITAHSFPLDRLAIRLISDNGWALDLYAWLAATLPGLDAPRRIPWPTLCDDWFAGHGERRKIKAKLLDTLPLVVAVYAAAHVEVDAEGLILHPSPATIRLAR